MSNVTAIKPLTFHNRQSDLGDSVFNTPLGFNTGKPSVVEDKDYNRPDYQMYVLSTMGQGLNTLYPNNMVTPVRIKPSLSGMQMINILSNYLDKKTSTNGVFIIEYYTLHNDPTAEIERCIDYYLNTNNLTFDYELKDDIYKMLGERRGNRAPIDMKIRLVTFIKENDIKEHSNVYVPGPNVVICNGKLNNVTHPNAYNKKNVSDSIKSIESDNVMYMEIVDNNGNKPYFIKIGNKIHKIFSTIDPAKPDGCSMFLKKNGTLDFMSMSCGLDKMEEELGIHSSYDNSLSEGNATKLSELEKIKLDKKKIEFEYHKLEHELKKMKLDMVHTKEKHNMDVYKKSLDIILMEEKAIIESITIANKFILDTKLALFKHSYDMDKSRYDILGKLLGLANTAIKLF